MLKCLALCQPCRGYTGHNILSSILTFRAQCGPRLSEEAQQLLKTAYIDMRRRAKELRNEGKSGIPITARQLEALGEIFANN